MESILTKHQEKRLGPVRWWDSEEGKNWFVICTVKYDDHCGNGHNSLHINLCGSRTEEGARLIRDRFGGSGYFPGMRDKELVELFPEVKDLLFFQGCNSDGPTYYIENTLYHARHIETYNTFVYLDEPLVKAGWGNNVLLGLYKNSTPDNPSEDMTALIERFHDFKLEYKVEPDGMNKESDLGAAQRTAFWPEATLEDFTKEKLEARLPELIERFRAAIEAFGLVY